jgi:hypothetical protein
MSRIDSQHWRDRAIEALTQAAEVDDDFVRRQLVQIALSYDRIAKLAADADPPTGDNEITGPLRYTPKATRV